MHLNSKAIFDSIKIKWCTILMLLSYCTVSNYWFVSFVHWTEIQNITDSFANSSWWRWLSRRQTEENVHDLKMFTVLIWNLYRNIKIITWKPNLLTSITSSIFCKNRGQCVFVSDGIRVSWMQKQYWKKQLSIPDYTISLFLLIIIIY